MSDLASDGGAPKSDQLGLGLGDNMMAPTTKNITAIAGAAPMPATAAKAETPPPLPKEPVPAPKPEAAAKSAAPKKPSEDIDALQKQLTDAIAALEEQNRESAAARRKFESMTSRIDEADRLNYLKDTLSAKGDMKDEHILKLAPVADPHTPEGRAQLDDFRMNNPNYFMPVSESPHVKAKEFQDRARKALDGNRMWDENYAVDLLRQNLRSK